MTSSMESVRSPLILTFLLGLILISTVNCQEDACDIYGDGYVCTNSSKASRRNFLSRSSKLDCDTDLYGTVIKLLDDGKAILDKELELIEGDEAVMIIGNTGTGKSTLTYFLAGDNSQMFAYQQETDVFLIKDCNGKIGGGDQSIVSATIFPDLVIENSTTTAFFDNPGFQDTRTACVEIANAYFMKEIANRVKKLKFIIVVNKADVSSTGTRDAFTNTLRNVLNFIPGIERFGSGLALVATKLAAINADDTPYVKDIVKFMNTSKQSFGEIFSDPDQLRKATFIVDSIADVNRVGVFRMPVECGPLSEIEMMQKNRANIMKVVLDNLEYVPTSPSDFALSISADAQISVLEIGKQLKISIGNSIQEFSSALYNHLMSQFDCINNTQSYCNSLVSDLKIVFSNPDLLDDYSNINSWNNLNFSTVVQRITNQSFVPPNLKLGSEFFEKLYADAEHMDFFSNLVVLDADFDPWVQPMKNINGYLKDQIVGLISSLDQTFVREIKELAEDFKAKFDGDLATLVEGKLADIPVFEETIKELYRAKFNLGQTVDDLKPSEYISEIKDEVKKFGKGFSNQGLVEETLDHVFGLSLNLNYLKTAVANKTVSINPKQWSSPFVLLQTEVFDSIQEKIDVLSRDLKYWLEQLLILMEDHYRRLSTSEESLYKNLDIAHRQFGYLSVFQKEVSQGQSRQIFLGNLKVAFDALNNIFLVLGSQLYVKEMISLEETLVVLEHINLGKEGLVTAEWVLNVNNGVTLILDQISDYAQNHVDSFVLRGAVSTGSKLTSKLRSAYEGLSSYSLPKQREFIEDEKRVNALKDQISGCTNLKCFSSKNFEVLTQLTAGIQAAELQKLPDQNLQVDLDDFGRHPYSPKEWIKPYEDALLVLTTVKKALSIDRPKIESPRLSNAGDWGGMDLCASGTFVSGFQLKNEDCTGGDCTAINGISFFCSPLSSNSKQQTISSLVGNRGDWKNELSCGGQEKAIGFEVRIDAPGQRRRNWPWSSMSLSRISWTKAQDSWFSWPPASEACGGGGGGDNWRVHEAAVNLRLICENGGIVEGDTYQDDHLGGVWSGQQRCKQGQVLCGIQTQVELNGGDGDWTGLNNLDAQCCYIVS